MQASNANNHDNVIAKSSVKPMLRMKGVALNASNPNAMSVVQADSVTLRIAVTRCSRPWRRKMP